MNNFEKIQSMSIDELAEFLDEHGQFDTAPWTQWWDCTYCKNCEPIMCKYEDSETEHPFAYCEIYGNCRFFQDKDEIPNSKEIVKMWLKSEAVDDELDELFALNDKRVDEMIEFEKGWE